MHICEVSTSYITTYVTTTTYQDRAADTHWAVNNGTCMQCIQYRWSTHGCNKSIAISSAVHKFKRRCTITLEVRFDRAGNIQESCLGCQHV